MNIPLSSNFSILYQLIHNEGLGDWREMNVAGGRIQQVTPADVKHVAAQYLVREQRAVGVYTRKAGSVAAGEDEDLAGLSPEQKQMMVKLAPQLQAETNVERLQKGLQGVEQAMAAGDPKRKAFMNLYKKKLEARLAELQKKP